MQLYHIVVEVFFLFFFFRFNNFDFVDTVQYQENGHVQSSSDTDVHKEDEHNVTNELVVGKLMKEFYNSRGSE